MVLSLSREETNMKTLFDVDIVNRCQGALPNSWQDVPPNTMVIAAGLRGVPHRTALHFIQGFNEAERANPAGVWAVLRESRAGAPDSIASVASTKATASPPPASLPDEDLYDVIIIERPPGASLDEQTEQSSHPKVLGILRQGLAAFAAVAYARGFNEAELASPRGCWAVIRRSKPEEQAD
jgi:hypothetical protein